MYGITPLLFQMGIDAPEKRFTNEDDTYKPNANGNKSLSGNFALNHLNNSYGFQHR